MSEYNEINHPSCNEHWKIIEDFPNYMISDLGNVLSLRTNKLRSVSIGKRGYPVVSLRKGGKTYLKTIHRLVAVAFIPNPLNLREVNHIDGIKSHSYKSNLEWVTPQQNIVHARTVGLHTSDGDKIVYQYTKSGELLHIYKSASEASRITGICRCNICSVARGNTNNKSAGGYIWKYERI